MKKITIIYLLIFTGIAFTSCYLYFSLYTYKNISSNIKTGQDKYDFLESSNALMLNLREAESFERGFIITNDSIYLNQYKKSIFNLELEVVRFYKISKSYGLENSSPKNIETMNLLINLKIREMNKIISLQNEGLGVETVKLIKEGRETKIMDNLVIVFQNLYADQKLKETQSKLMMYNTRKQFITANIVTSIFIIIVLVLIAIFVRLSWLR